MSQFDIVYHRSDILQIVNAGISTSDYLIDSYRSNSSQKMTQPFILTFTTIFYNLRFVLLTIIRRILQVNQFCFIRFLDVSTDRPQFSSAFPLDEFHVRGSLVTLKKRLAHLSEGGQSLPTDLDTTRTRHTMAFACSTHPRFDTLEK